MQFLKNHGLRNRDPWQAITKVYQGSLTFYLYSQYLLDYFLNFFLLWQTLNLGILQSLNFLFLESIAYIQDVSTCDFTVLSINAL